MGMPTRCKDKKRQWSAPVIADWPFWTVNASIDGVARRELQVAAHNNEPPRPPHLMGSVNQPISAASPLLLPCKPVKPAQLYEMLAVRLRQKALPQNSKRET
jgi:hypothetical protein